MKAKDWYAKIVDCKTENDTQATIADCLKSLVEDANKLIKMRKATSDKAVASCLDEVNNRWIAICNLHEKANYDKAHPLYNISLLKDGFKAAFVHLNPNKGWYFDLKRYKNYIKNEEDKIHQKLIMGPALKLFNVTPFDQITMDNIDSEILENLYLIGSYYNNPAVTSTLLMPLVHRCRLLRYWRSTERIDYEDTIKMQEDPFKFFEERNIPI